MSEKKRTDHNTKEPKENTRLDPELKVCPMFDIFSIKDISLPKKEMGVRVVDNCAEEHIM